MLHISMSWTAQTHSRTLVKMIWLLRRRGMSGREGTKNMYIILHLVRDESLDKTFVLVQYVSETGLLQREFILIDFPSAM